MKEVPISYRTLEALESLWKNERPNENHEMDAFPFSTNFVLWLCEQGIIIVAGKRFILKSKDEATITALLLRC